MNLENNIEEVAIEANLKQFLLVLSISLSVATLPQLFSWFRQIPYTLLLVIVGLGLAFIDVRLVYLSPQLILFIFLPPILFEAAWNLEWSHLKRDLVPSCLYAVLGVLISIAGVALALQQLPGISLTTVLLVGASLAATDSVSVISLFRQLGVEKRLTTLMEGESLFNDGVAAVAFGLLMGLALGTDEFEISTTLARFLGYVGIGIGTGSLIGFGSSYLTQRLDLPLVEQLITLISAYGSYLLTEELGGSGFIGVATAGLILGNFGSRTGMNPRTRLAVTEFWDFLAFFVNSMDNSTASRRKSISYKISILSYKLLRSNNFEKNLKLLKSIPTPNLSGLVYWTTNPCLYCRKFSKMGMRTRFRSRSGCSSDYIFSKVIAVR